MIRDFNLIDYFLDIMNFFNEKYLKFKMIFISLNKINKPFLIKDYKIPLQRPIHLRQSQLSQSFLGENYHRPILSNLLLLFLSLEEK